jgi:hypothetical protein
LSLVPGVKDARRYFVRVADTPGFLRLAVAAAVDGFTIPLVLVHRADNIKP